MSLLHPFGFVALVSSLSGCLYDECDPPTAEDASSLEVWVLRYDKLGFASLGDNAVSTQGDCGPATCIEHTSDTSVCIRWQASMLPNDGASCTVTVSAGGGSSTFVVGPETKCDVATAPKMSLHCCTESCSSVAYYSGGPSEICG